MHDSSPIRTPSGPQPRKSIHPNGSEANNLNNSKESLMKQAPRQRQKSSSERDVSSDSNSDSDQQIDDHDELDKKSNNSTPKSQNSSKTFSPEGANKYRKKSQKTLNKSQNKEFLLSTHKEDTYQRGSPILKYMSCLCVVIAVIFILYNQNLLNSTSESQTEFTKKSLFETIELLRTKFHNQDLHIWDDVLSGIDEVKRRTPTVPSIILLFANETYTMDCLASSLAHLSSEVLGGDNPLNLNPKDFGNDTGEIINYLKNITTKKAVIIHDVLSINTEAIKALHHLCDRINPLIREVVYIITMQTRNYELSQKKMDFVEKQIKSKLSKSIDEDILSALVTRITDGAIISVKPEPNLRYC